ncbi:hypothetical protein M9H77_30327 [Catharanthus roseus]|uniref:Uncharacterized protein n=1 Tax=Catharanthus roseus TaxID=4058 RepID=A0ACB9ZWX7_CATRO|nr:hypothetical protein M9H77_30327 [Catharanthus roseus]
MDNTPSRLGHIPRTYSTRSEHSFISPLIEEKDYVPYRVSTSQVSERDEHNHHEEKVFKNKENTVKENEFSERLAETKDYKPIIKDEINKLYKFADRPTQRINYYSRPSPVDILHEEQEYIGSSNEDCLTGESQDPDMDEFSEDNIDHMILILSGWIVVLCNDSRFGLKDLELAIIITKIRMDNTQSRLGNIPRTYSTRSEHSFISPLIEENDYVPYRVSTSQVSERDESNHHVEKVLKKDNIVKGIYNTKDAEITESEMNFSL